MWSCPLLGTSMWEVDGLGFLGKGFLAFGLHTESDNIRDYAGLYTKKPFLALSLALSLIPRRPSSTSRFLWKTLYIVVWMASRPIFLGFNRTP
ncbi:hypothetical protein ZWY2020_032610 [Hordeum vulgare]|nr:hypothetical protein ZWY2020_032610 [Hordeum vulgare]